MKCQPTHSVKICLLQQPGEAAGRKAELPILGSGHNYSEAQWGWGLGKKWEGSQEGKGYVEGKKIHLEN